MLVSIIIPCYNVEQFIEECIDSVMAQSFKSIEVICIDNNSIDSTWDRLNNLKIKYPNIIIEKELKPGAPCARNKGLLLANGNWIQFLDADDILDEKKIEYQVKLIERNNNQIDFIAAPFTNLKADKSKSDYKVRTDPWEGLILTELGFTSSNLFKASKLKEVGGWDEKLKSSQEYDLMFRLMKSGAFVLIDTEIRTIKRERELGSISKVDVKGNVVRLIERLISVRLYLTEINKLSEYNKLINQAIFDKIRELANYDLALSESLFNKSLPNGYVPNVSLTTGKNYIRIYRVFGFSGTEHLRLFLLKFLGKQKKK